MGKFKVKKTDTGFTFSLLAGNGEIIGISEVYTTKTACLNGIDSVKRNAAKANIEDQTEGESASCPKFEIFENKAGQFNFRLKATNGEIILSSEAYSAKAGCKNGINSVIKNAPDAETIEAE